MSDRLEMRDMLLATELERQEEAGSKEHFAELVQRIKAAGLLERRSRLYGFRVVSTFSFLLIAWALVIVVGNSWWTVAAAVFVGLAFTHAAFLAHDAGHRQAFRSKSANDVLLLITGDVLTGISGSWWFSKHHRHHAHPNNIELDPDVRVSFFSYSAAQIAQKTGLRRFSARYQHVLYFPMSTLQGWSLHFASIAAVLRKDVVKRPGLERGLLAVHFVAYFGVLAAVLPFGKMIVFVLIHQAVFGFYLSATFAPNHKGMAMFTEEPPFMRHQVLTSRNVTGGRFVEWLTGGLNYQIEHHLFPSMPRPNLKHAQPIVEKYCSDIGLSYEQQNLFASFRSVVGFFKRERLS